MVCYLSNEVLLAGSIREAGIRYIIYAGDASDSVLFKILSNMPELKICRAIDERNAAYYAMGIAIESGMPVAVIASDGTAASNYLPAATEAYYQNIPLLMIEERTDGAESVWHSSVSAFDSVSGCVLCLPKVRSKEEERRNTVEICHAIGVLENNIKGRTPVFISYVKSGQDGGEYRSDKNYICSVSAFSEQNIWKKKAEELDSSKGIVFVLEDDTDISVELISAFIKRFGCQLVTGPGVVQIAAADSLTMSSIMRSRSIDLSNIEHIISISKTAANRIERIFRNVNLNNIHHWHIAEDGSFYDPFGRLDTVFCVSVDYFARSLITLSSQTEGEQKGKIKISGQMDNNSKVSQILGKMISEADECCVQFSVCGGTEILDAIQLTKKVRLITASAGNVSTGCLSIFLGFAFNNSKECYLVIDDKSFYKDMNALAVRHVSNNIHILLLDTGYVSHMSYYGKTEESYGADSTREWLRDVGISYIEAKDIDDGISKMAEFTKRNNSIPVLMKVSVGD